jgi:hypothetical protein
MLDRSRFTGIIFGVVCLLAAVYEFIDGHGRYGTLGMLLGVGIIAVWEWVVWRAGSGNRR